MARKTDIIDLLLTEMKGIDGETDTRAGVPDIPYTYKSKVFNNVFRKFKYIDEINDFPTICFIVGSEGRQHIGAGVRYGSLEITVRGYVYSENVLNAADDLADDIEHVLNSLGYLAAFCPVEIVESRVIRVGTDEGLFEPHGIVDIAAEIVYEISENPTVFISVFSDPFVQEFA